MKTPLALIHASPAALAPLNDYYSEHAPELEITNLLDDGLLRAFRAADWRTARETLQEMIDAARWRYDAAVAVVTCSTATAEMMDALRADSPVRLIKIDEPLADQAVSRGQRILVLVTFASTLDTTIRLFERAAVRCGRSPELIPVVVDGAYDALLVGDAEEHDRLVIEAAEQAMARAPDAIVLGQVSMSRVRDALGARTGLPVYDALATSLAEVRRLTQPEGSTDEA